MESIINEQYHLSNRNFNTSERNKGQETKNLLKVNYKINEKQRVPKLRVNPDFKGNPIFKEKIKSKETEPNIKSHN